MQLKVLVVDDSVVYRRVLSDALRSLPQAQVVGSVANGSCVVALKHTGSARSADNND